MAEITPAQRLHGDDEEMIMALWDHVHDAGADDVDQGLAADLVALRSRVAALLLQQLQDTTPPLSPESWRWAESAEVTARGAAKTLAAQAADIERALSLLSRWPAAADSDAEAEAFLAALRRQAAYTAARRADADEIAAARRLIREEEMRRMAEAEEGLLHPDAAAFLAAAGEAADASPLARGDALRRLAAAEHLVHPAAAAFLGYIAGETDASLARGEAMPAGELALAPQVEDEAARMEETMAELACRLRRGAAELFAGDQPLVAALHRHAASADAARATIEAFTASVRRFRAAAGSAVPPAAPATGTDCYLRPRFRAAGSALPPTGTGTGSSLRPKL